MTNINFATATTEQLAEAGFTVTTLKTRGPRKGEATMSRVGGAKTAWRPAAKAGHASRRQRNGATAAQ
jgi:hypothetical protein